MIAWIMCATSESSDHYCCCGSWDHKPSQEQIDAIRVKLDSVPYSGHEHGKPEDMPESFIVIDGNAYVTYILDYSVSQVSIISKGE